MERALAADVSSIRVRVAGADAPGAPERLYVTRGADHAEGRMVDGLPYRAGAIVPRPGWRPLGAGERAVLLTSDADEPLGTTIDVLPAPGELVAIFRALGFAPGATLAGCHAALRGETYVEALHAAVPLLYPLVESEERLQLLGTCVQRGDLWSTTTHVDRDGTESFSGLHVDNWDQLAPGQRHVGRRQLSINLGLADRFFVFVARPIDELAQSIAGEQGYTGYARELFARAPETALFKVRVRPGELYLAPTDNLVHDGTTIDSDGPDITLNLRGYFRVPAADADVPSLTHELGS